MSKFKGKGAVINDPGAITHGKPCVIKNYDGKLKKDDLCERDRKAQRKARRVCA